MKTICFHPDYILCLIPRINHCPEFGAYYFQMLSIFIVFFCVLCLGVVEFLVSVGNLLNFQVFIKFGNFFFITSKIFFLFTLLFSRDSLITWYWVDWICAIAHWCDSYFSVFFLYMFYVGHFLLLYLQVYWSFLLKCLIFF